MEGVAEITDVDDSDTFPEATMAATGLVAVDSDGVRHELGGIVLVNTGWRVQIE